MRNILEKNWLLVVLVTLSFMMSGCGAVSGGGENNDTNNTVVVDNNDTNATDGDCTIEMPISNPDTVTPEKMAKYKDAESEVFQLKKKKATYQQVMTAEVEREKSLIDVARAKYDDIVWDFQQSAANAFIRHYKVEEKLKTFFDEIKKRPTHIYDTARWQVGYTRIQLFGRLNVDTYECDRWNECYVRDEDTGMAKTRDYFQQVFFADISHPVWNSLQKLIKENVNWVWKNVFSENTCMFMSQLQDQTINDLVQFIETWIKPAIKTAQEAAFQDAVENYLVVEIMGDFAGSKKKLEELRNKVIYAAYGEYSFEDAMAIYRLFSDNGEVWQKIADNILKSAEVLNGVGFDYKKTPQQSAEEKVITAWMTGPDKITEIAGSEITLAQFAMDKANHDHIESGNMQVQVKVKISEGRKYFDIDDFVVYSVSDSGYEYRIADSEDYTIQWQSDKEAVINVYLKDVWLAYRNNFSIKTYTEPDVSVSYTVETVSFTDNEDLSRREKDLRIDYITPLNPTVVTVVNLFK